MMRVPGFDWLVPSPEDSDAAIVLEEAAMKLGVCLPPDFRAANANASTRPSRFPGTQNITTFVPQPDCINSSSTVAPMRRCWANLGFVVDMAFEGMDPNPSGVPIPNHYDVLVLGVWTLCEVVVSKECVEKGDPISCMLLARGKGPAAAAAPDSAAGASSNDSAGVALPVALSVGGAALLAAVALAAVWWWRRRRTPPSSVGLRSASTNSSPTGGSLICSTAAAAKAPDGQDPEPDLDPDPASHACLSNVRTTTHSGSKVEYGSHLHLDRQGTPSANRALAAPWPGVVTPETPFGANLNLSIQIACGSTTSASIPIATYETGSSLSILLGGVCRAAVEGACDPWPRAPPAAAAAPTAAAAGGPKTLSSPSGPAEGCSSGSAVSAAAAAGGVSPEDVVELLPAVLGKGSFGRVVEGIYRGERVAVKHIYDEQDVWTACGGEGSLLRALTQEVDVLGRCRHPNIVRLIAASVQPPRLGLVMELMETSLDRLMYDKGPGAKVLPLGLVLHIASEVARGLEYLHPTIVHRDLKPANVLINNAAPGGKPVVKLADFGLSRLRRTVVPTATPSAGTPAYMAPECFDVRNDLITHQADIYSFGVLLWEMLIGVRPWARLDAVQVAIRVVVHDDRPPLPPASFQGQGQGHRWPPKLRRLTQQCWEKDPQRRPAAAEVAKTLLLVAQALPPSELALGADA